MFALIRSYLIVSLSESVDTKKKSVQIAKRQFQMQSKTWSAVDGHELQKKKTTQNFLCAWMLEIHTNYHLLLICAGVCRRVMALCHNFIFALFHLFALALALTCNQALCFFFLLM